MEQEADYTADAAKRASWTFPPLAWLEEIIAKDKWERVLLVFMPVHRRSSRAPARWRRRARPNARRESR
jgi:hypothetical protein